MSIRCYAQRLLNPFRGVMNIIEHQGAEAVTIDGVHWDIYVRDTDLVEDLANNRKVQTSDIRYGSWSEQDGLRRGAIYPSNDFRVLEHRGAIVYEHLLQHCQDIPFPFQDTIELWLLDPDHQPLGLLDSVLFREDIELDRPISWRAGRDCQRSFISPALEKLPTTTDNQSGAGEYLTKYINALAGSQPQAQWFQRQPDGSGDGLEGIQLSASISQRRLPGSAFPAWFLRRSGHDAAHSRLIEDFFNWQSPCLLLLQGITTKLRAELEESARSRALQVEKNFRFYPEIINPEAINAARVEARLRSNLPEPVDEQETLSTYYIELNISRTN